MKKSMKYEVIKPTLRSKSPSQDFLEKTKKMKANSLIELY